MIQRCDCCHLVVVAAVVEVVCLIAVVTTLFSGSVLHDPHLYLHHPSLRRPQIKLLREQLALMQSQLSLSQSIMAQQLRQQQQPVATRESADDLVWRVFRIVSATL
jgi:hypothetical protein